jgi:hypothetical protein
MMTRISESIDLRLPIQFGFGLSGFLLAGFLLRARETVDSASDAVVTSKQGSWSRTFLQGVPIPWLVLVIAGVLYLPQILALESIPLKDLDEIVAWLGKVMVTWFSDFQKSSMDGRTLIVWPVVLLLAPRRLLGLVFLTLLGWCLMSQVSSLLSGEIRPVSVLVKPSAVDLLSGGGLVGAMFHGGGDSENGRLGRWAILMGLVLAFASIGFWYQKGMTTWGTLTVLSAPPGFGAVNFILEIVGTTLVASLAWRDVGDLLESLKRSPYR